MSTKVNNKKYYKGCLLPSKEKLQSFPSAMSISKMAGKLAVIPTMVDLSSEFPAPGKQGQQNCCTAWATAYAYKSFQEKLEHQWKLSTTDHQFSPAYVYNQINGGRDQGSYIDEALKLFVNQGVCSLKVMPYDDTDYLTQPTTSQKTAAAPYKAIQWGTFAAGDVNAIKGHIAGGDAVVVGIPVYPDFENISSANPIYDDASGTLEGYHAICFVGYDDSKSAFKFINSWGADWGLNGFGYMSYELVKNLDVVGYIMTDKLND
jgi:C1A family cysteine protease